jgi:hypothetical protein
MPSGSYWRARRRSLPNRDQLAAQEIRFDFAHRACGADPGPSATPASSHGLYPYEHGVRDHSGYRLKRERHDRDGLDDAGFATVHSSEGCWSQSSSAFGEGLDVYDDRFGRGAVNNL